MAHQHLQIAILDRIVCLVEKLLYGVLGVLLGRAEGRDVAPAHTEEPDVAYGSTSTVDPEAGFGEVLVHPNIVAVARHSHEVTRYAGKGSQYAFGHLLTAEIRYVASYHYDVADRISRYKLLDAGHPSVDIRYAEQLHGILDLEC